MDLHSEMGSLPEQVTADTPAGECVCVCVCVVLLMLGGKLSEAGYKYIFLLQCFFKWKFMNNSHYKTVILTP